MPADQEIHNLCLRAAHAQDHQELNDLLIELRISLRERLQSAENLGIHLILKAPKSARMEF